jgi:hypothetical protein
MLPEMVIGSKIACPSFSAWMRKLTSKPPKMVFQGTMRMLTDEPWPVGTEFAADLIHNNTQKHNLPLVQQRRPGRRAFLRLDLPDSKVTAIHEAPGDYPGGKAGDVLTVEFTVLGIPLPRSQRRAGAQAQRGLFLPDRHGQSGRDGSLLERDRRQWRH